MKTQLLCTFTTKPRLNETLDIIILNNDVLYEKVYVFQNENDLGQLICTYNIEYKYEYEESIIDTISLHRKKQSNTLYTINALNELVKEENGGVLDKSFSIDWDKFKNSIIVTNVEGTKKISTRIFEVIEFNQK